MRVLITNDDGVESAGLRLLADAVCRLNHDVSLIAPDRDFRGCGTSASRPDISVPAVMTRVALGERCGSKVCAPPGCIVRSTCRGELWPPPDLVLCGVNDGRNTGTGIFGSRTFGAAFLASASHGIPAAATSSESVDELIIDCLVSILQAFVFARPIASNPLLTSINFPITPNATKRRFASLGDEFASLEVTVVGENIYVKAG